MAALWADHVRRLDFAATGAVLQLLGNDEVMRPTGAGAAVRRASLGYGHDSEFYAKVRLVSEAKRQEITSRPAIRPPRSVENPIC